MTDLNPASSELQRAYALIQSDNLTAARDLLDDYLITHPNDPDAWWLYAHAVTDADEAQSALQTVLRLRPNYPGASELLEESQELLVFNDEDFDDEPLTPATSASTSTDTIETPAVSTARTEAIPASTSTTGMQRPIFLVAAIIVALLLIGLAVILANQANTPVINPTISPAATTIAQTTNTPASTAEIIAGATEEMTVAGTEAAEYDALYAALADFEVIDNSVVTEDAAIGQTVLVSICNDQVEGLRNTSINALTALASSSSSLEAAGPELIGIRVLDCQRDNFVLRILAVAYADAEAYAAGEITEADLTSRLVVIS